MQNKTARVTTVYSFSKRVKLHKFLFININICICTLHKLALNAVYCSSSSSRYYDSRIRDVLQVDDMRIIINWINRRIVYMFYVVVVRVWLWQTSAAVDQQYNVNWPITFDIPANKIQLRGNRASCHQQNREDEEAMTTMSVAIVRSRDGQAAGGLKYSLYETLLS